MSLEPPLRPGRLRRRTWARPRRASSSVESPRGRQGERALVRHAGPRSVACLARTLRPVAPGACGAWQLDRGHRWSVVLAAAGRCARRHPSLDRLVEANRRSGI